MKQERTNSSKINICMKIFKGEMFTTIEPKMHLKSICKIVRLYLLKYLTSRYSFLKANISK